MYDDEHQNKTIDDWIIDDTLCEEIFPVKKVTLLTYIYKEKIKVYEKME